MIEVAEIVNTAEDFVDREVAHKFTKYDWYGWAGASELPDGSGPFISNYSRYVVLLSGPSDGYIDSNNCQECSISVNYVVNDDFDKDETVCWNKDLPNYLENCEGYVRLYNSLCRMMNNEELSEKVVDSFCYACGFEKIL